MVWHVMFPLHHINHHSFLPVENLDVPRSLFQHIGDNLLNLFFKCITGR